MILRRLAVLVALATLLAACNSSPTTAWDPVPSAPGPQSADGLDEEELLARKKFSTTGSRVVVAMFDLPLAALFLAAVALASMHRRRARAEAAVDPLAPLADGPAVVVGVVELEAADARPALEVRIRQRGAEAKSKGNWSHSWTESEREVRARPFHIVRGDGSRVRVEPEVGRFALHDALSRMISETRELRVRVAELTAGERVFVTGTLSGAVAWAGQLSYRAGAGVPVLRAPALGKLLVSTEPPGDTSSARARFHLKWALALVAITVGLSAIVFPTYRALTLLGEPVTAQAVATRTWQEWVKPKNSAGYWVPHWAVRARLAREAGGGEVEDECGARAYAELNAGRATSLPFVILPGSPSFAQLGASPTLSSGQVIGLSMALIAVLFGYALSVHSTRPWYAKSKLVETGSGRLAA